MICSKELVNYVLDLTKNKTKIPDIIYKNRNNKKYFIIGLMDSDGWITKVNAKDGYIRYRVGFKNKFDFTNKIRRLFLHFNVKVGKLREVENYRKKKKTFAYTFSINTFDYCKNIGFGIKRKQKLAKDYFLFLKRKRDAIKR